MRRAIVALSLLFAAIRAASLAGVAGIPASEIQGMQMPVLETVAHLKLPARTLDGEERVFPADADVPRSVFVVTFTKAASEQGRAWSNRLREDKDKLGVAVFQASVIEDVPRMFRSSVSSAMAKQVPKELHDRYWVVTADGEEWRRIIASTSSKEASVIVVDHRCCVVWQGHGEVTDEKIRKIATLQPADPPKSANPPPSSPASN